VLASVPDTRVVFLGDGPLRPSITALAEELGIAGSVTFLGIRPVVEILRSSDLFVLPSLWEGLPMALLEAMAARLPVIATEVAGSRQVVRDGVDGMLVPPGDATRLQDAITSMLSDDERRGRLAEAARRRVEDRYSVERQADAHVALYRGLTGRSATDG
jgi:glycosyltransferase involved in cell wall biosynthesis